MGIADSARWNALAASGFNVFNLPEDQLLVDLFTDIQPRAPFPPLADTRFPSTMQTEPALKALAAELYGPWRYLAVCKGRGAENALVAALQLPERAVAIGHPLFMSFEHALVQRGIQREVTPWRAEQATSNVDLAWLGARLSAGGVHLVVLEPACNALGGRPLELDNVAAAARLCREHAVPLVLDATRLLGNCHALGMTPLIEAAHAFTALADAVTVSCAKELLGPYGGLVAVKDLATQKRAWQYARMEGTLLEPHAERVTLAQGCERMLRHPEVVADRARQLTALADALARAGVEVIAPRGVHAIFIAVPEAIAAGGAPAIRAFEAHVYLRTGARVISHAYAKLPGRVARLALGIGRYRDDELAPLAEGISYALRHHGEAPVLVEVPHEELSPNRVRYRVEGA